MTTTVLEIHGRAGCPFAWRARLAAAAKGVAFDSIPFDVDAPDPRASKNVEKRSPLLIHAERHLRESAVIAQYLDEAFAGPALQPADPWERARMRLTIVEMEGLLVDGRPGAVVSEDARARVERTFDRLEALLGEQDFLGGASPSLADLLAWPPLAVLASKGLAPDARRPRAHAYWERVKVSSLFTETKPRVDFH